MSDTQNRSRDLIEENMKEETFDVVKELQERLRTNKSEYLAIEEIMSRLGVKQEDLDCEDNMSCECDNEYDEEETNFLSGCSVVDVDNGTVSVSLSYELSESETISVKIESTREKVDNWMIEGMREDVEDAMYKKILDCVLSSV